MGKLLPPSSRQQRVAHVPSPPPNRPLQDLWGKVMWLWDRPHVQKIRLTVSMANFR